MKGSARLNLANKYRPTQLNDVLSQDTVVDILSSNKFKELNAHNFLFVGPSGCGKTTCARILAQELGEVIEVDAASNNSAERIKELAAQARMAPLVGENKVLIIDEAHTLSAAAWAAMLIILEENISRTYFIFCTTELRKIPSTILSRVYTFQFNAISFEDIEKRLKLITEKEGISADDSALRLIARNSNNNLRQAITNLEKCLFYQDYVNIDVVQRVMSIVDDAVLQRLFESKDSREIITIMNKITEDGINLQVFVANCLHFAIARSITDSSYIERVRSMLRLTEVIRTAQNIKYAIIGAFISKRW